MAGPEIKSPPKVRSSVFVCFQEIALQFLISLRARRASQPPEACIGLFIFLLGTNSRSLWSGLLAQEGLRLISVRHPNQNTVLKIIVAGDGGVGKTSLIRRYVSDRFDPAERITIGCDFYTKVLNSHSGQQFKLQIWDVGGQEQFRALLPLWLKGSRGLILAFDVGSIESYLHLDEWLSIVLEGGMVENFPIVVVGNKRDLSDGSITETDLDQYIKKRGIDGYYLVSAKDGVSVSSPFMRLLDLIADQEAGDGGMDDGRR